MTRTSQALECEQIMCVISKFLTLAVSFHFHVYQHYTDMNISAQINCTLSLVVSYMSISQWFSQPRIFALCICRVLRIAEQNGSKTT